MPVAPVPGAPARDAPALAALPDEWTWIDFPDSRCANGSPTGVAVNLHPNATHVLVFLEGGGACADAKGCWVEPTAVNIAHGYGVLQFGHEKLLRLPLFERTSHANPFSDASYVFVPYCTGDLHAGDNVATYDVDGKSTPTYHYGGHNIDVFLKRLGTAFPGVDHVWLAGESAGGFGTLFNQDFVARAFGVRTDVIDDSGPGIGMSGYPDSWKVRLPPGCSYCQLGLAPLFAYDRATYPEARFAFLSFEVDALLPGFFGATSQDVITWLSKYEASFDSIDNTRSFVTTGTGHVVMGSLGDAEAEAGHRLLGWLTAMATDDPSWADATPPVERGAAFTPR